MAQRPVAAMPPTSSDSSTMPIAAVPDGPSLPPARAASAAAGSGEDPLPRLADESPDVAGEGTGPIAVGACAAGAAAGGGSTEYEGVENDDESVAVEPEYDDEDAESLELSDAGSVVPSTAGALNDSW